MFTVCCIGLSDWTRYSNFPVYCSESNYCHITNMHQTMFCMWNQ